MGTSGARRNVQALPDRAQWDLRAPSGGAQDHQTGPSGLEVVQGLSVLGSGPTAPAGSSGLVICSESSEFQISTHGRRACQVWAHHGIVTLTVLRGRGCLVELTTSAAYDFGLLQVRLLIDGLTATAAPKPYRPEVTRIA